jgi:hypothetical protein
MSMIDCRVKIERKPDPKGDRVLLIFEYVFFTPHLSCAHQSSAASSCRTSSGRQNSIMYLYIANYMRLRQETLRYSRDPRSGIIYIIQRRTRDSYLS